MAGETVITVIGTVTADPELRFVSNGNAVANFTVASNSRRLNKETGKWEDADALFLRCNIWRQAAENTAESLSKGDRVIVVGRLKQRSYETREGEKRTVMELEVDELGPSIKFRPAQVSKATRESSTSTASDNPWATAAPVTTPNGGAAGYDDEPPF